MAAQLSLWEREFIVMTAQILIYATGASKTKHALGREFQICFFSCKMVTINSNRTMTLPYASAVVVVVVPSSPQYYPMSECWCHDHTLFDYICIRGYAHIVKSAVMVTLLLRLFL